MILSTRTKRPIRILEFASATGSGGGPDKTVLLGSALTDPKQFDITVCYIRHYKDEAFDIEDRALSLGLEFVAIEERRRLDPSVWRAVRQLVRDRQIDVVHSHGYKADLITLMLSRAEGVIPLSTVHGFSGHTWRERFVYYPLDRRALARFPRVIAVSEGLRRALLRAGARPDRVHTIFNGIDHRNCRRIPGRVPECRAELGLSPNEIAIGSIGRVEPEKRFDVLVEAFAKLLPLRPELRLFIVGEGSLRGDIELLAEQLGIGHACRCLGHRGDIGRVYQSLDLFVQSSDSEGSPNVVLEAMAFEVPVVATDVGGTTELVQDDIHALLVPPRDPERLAQAISRALREESETKRRVAAARARVERELSFETRMRAVEQVYEELMVECRGRRSNGDARVSCVPRSTNA